MDNRGSREANSSNGVGGFQRPKLQIINQYDELDILIESCLSKLEQTSNSIYKDSANTIEKKIINNRLSYNTKNVDANNELKYNVVQNELKNVIEEHENVHTNSNAKLILNTKQYSNKEQKNKLDQESVDIDKIVNHIIKTYADNDVNKLNQRLTEYLSICKQTNNKNNDDNNDIPKINVPAPGFRFAKDVSGVVSPLTYKVSTEMRSTDSDIDHSITTRIQESESQTPFDNTTLTHMNVTNHEKEIKRLSLCEIQSQDRRKSQDRQRQRSHTHQTQRYCRKFDKKELTLLNSGIDKNIFIEMNQTIINITTNSTDSNDSKNFNSSDINNSIEYIQTNNNSNNDDCTQKQNYQEEKMNQNDNHVEYTTDKVILDNNKTLLDSQIYELQQSLEKTNDETNNNIIVPKLDNNNNNNNNVQAIDSSISISSSTNSSDIDDNEQKYEILTTTMDNSGLNSIKQDDNIKQDNIVNNVNYNGVDLTLVQNNFMLDVNKTIQNLGKTASLQNKSKLDNLESSDQINRIIRSKDSKRFTQLIIYKPKDTNNIKSDTNKLSKSNNSKKLSFYNNDDTNNTIINVLDIPKTKDTINIDEEKNVNTNNIEKDQNMDTTRPIGLSSSTTDTIDNIRKLKVFRKKMENKNRSYSSDNIKNKAGGRFTKNNLSSSSLFNNKSQHKSCNEKDINGMSGSTIDYAESFYDSDQSESNNTISIDEQNKKSKKLIKLNLSNNDTQTNNTNDSNLTQTTSRNKSIFRKSKKGITNFEGGVIYVNGIY